jgi:4-hydroxybenzoate polyprenyltransferase
MITKGVKRVYDFMQYLTSSRPRFWIYLFGPYLLGAASLLAAGVAENHLLPLIIFGIYFLFPANLFIYGVNDIFDYETDVHNIKKHGYETLVKPDRRKHLALVIALVNIPFIIAAFFLLPMNAIAGLIGFLFFGFFYSAPPIRAKTKPFLDAFFNVLYVFPALVSFGFIGLPATGIFIAATLWCMAMHAYSAIPDITADKKAGLQTVATVLGIEKTLLFCFLLYAAAFILTVQALGPLSGILSLFYGGMMLLTLKTPTEEHARKMYRYFPPLNTVCGALLTLFVLYGTLHF